jgi:hypothetical protein
MLVPPSEENSPIDLLQLSREEAMEEDQPH